MATAKKLQYDNTAVIVDYAIKDSKGNTIDAANYATLTNLSTKQDVLNASQMNAVNSGITSTNVSSFNTHISNSTIHVTSTNKATWDAKQDALNSAQISAVNSGITTSYVSSYNTHIGDSTIHVTSTNKATWDAKQSALNTAQMSAVNSGITTSTVSSFTSHIGDSTIHINSTERGNWNNKSTVSVNASGTSTTEVGYITINGSEYKLGGSSGGGVTSITAGTGLTGGTITSSGTIAINTSVVAQKSDLPEGELDISFNGTATSNTATLTNIIVGNQTYIVPNASGFVTKDVNDLTYYTTTANLSNVAKTGNYSDLLNKPTTLSYFTNDTGFVTNSSAQIAISQVTSLSSSLSSMNTSISGKQNAINSSNKLDYVYLSNTPTVDTTYNASSTNAQSGTALASAISGKQNTLSQGIGINIASNTIKVTGVEYKNNGTTQSTALGFQQCTQAYYDSLSSTQKEGTFWIITG